MAHVQADRVKDTTTSTGTGTVTLANAPASTFITVGSIAGIANNDTFDYGIFHQSANEWEVGKGTWITANQFTRADASVYSGSGGAGARVSFSAGTKTVILTIPALRLLNTLDALSVTTNASSADTLNLIGRVSDNIAAMRWRDADGTLRASQYITGGNALHHNIAGGAVYYEDGSGIVPEASNTYSLGSSAALWLGVYGTTYFAGTAKWTVGTSSPEGVVTAPIGSMYSQTDGVSGAQLWKKSTGTGNTGWMPLGWRDCVLASDHTMSSVTPANLAGVVFTPAVSKKYEVHGKIMTRTATTTVGARIGITWPSTMTDGSASITSSSSATAQTVQYSAGPATVTNAATGLADTTTSWMNIIEATLITGASTSGTFQVQISSETGGTNVIARAGSFIRYREFA